MAVDKLERRGSMTMCHLFNRAKPNGHAPSKTCNSFLRITHLPPELILSISDHLDQEFKVLLSLSCKHLHRILNARLDLSLRDVDLRANFLRHLEIDHPEYLSCRVCGWMYLWQKQRFLGYDCPRLRYHPRETMGWCGFIVVSPLKGVYINRELLALILRAYRWGPQHGLPVSLLDSDGPFYSEITLKSVQRQYPAFRGVRLQTQGRMVDGQLMLSSHWTIRLNSVEDLESILDLFDAALCWHSWNGLGSRLCREITMRIPCTEESEQPILHKCSACATDHKVYLQKPDHEGLCIILEVWRNFGNGYSNTQDIEQMFNIRNELDIGSESLSRRDLEAAFLSKEA